MIPKLIGNHTSSLYRLNSVKVLEVANGVVTTNEIVEIDVEPSKKATLRVWASLASDTTHLCATALIALV